MATDCDGSLGSDDVRSSDLEQGSKSYEDKGLAVLAPRLGAAIRVSARGVRAGVVGLICERTASADGCRECAWRQTEA